LPIVVLAVLDTKYCHKVENNIRRAKCDDIFGSIMSLSQDVVSGRVRVSL